MRRGDAAGARLLTGFEPDEDGCEADSAAPVDGVFIIPGGDGSPVLEPVEGPFDDVAAAVELGLKSTGRPPLEPRLWRLAIWSDGSGITAVIPRARRCWRWALAE